MFRKKTAENDSIDEQKEKIVKNKKALFVFLLVGGFILGVLIGKVYMQNELDRANEAKASLMQSLQDVKKNTNNENQEIQKRLIETLDKEKELGDAFENAISVQEAIDIINRKIEMVKSNTERLKRSYIDDNPEAKSLDYKVIKELLRVVDDDASRQMTNLKQAINVLNTYQKDKDLIIKRDVLETDTQKLKVQSKIDKIDSVDIKETIIEPLGSPTQSEEAQ